MLVVVFSLSPCSLKRDVLNIFDIQHISGLNKVKITAGPASTCELSTETSSSKAAFAKADRKIKDKSFFLNSASNSGFGEKKNNPECLFRRDFRKQSPEIHFI